MLSADQVTPHPIPYQGSKRLLADRILANAPVRVRTLIEPFAGSAAVTLAAAHRGLAERYVFGDALLPLAALWQLMLERPERVAQAYRRRWSAQQNNPAAHFLAVRERFNRTGDPVDLLFLLARCVKSAVRFNRDGQFNQSADHRRLGMHPDRMAEQLCGAAALLGGRARVRGGDYAALLRRATPDDLVYLDPPYQGVSGGRDQRYRQVLDLPRLVGELQELNRRGVPFVLSFDGRCGDKRYGVDLPASLRLRKVMLDAGRSAQATLHGRAARTIEALYLSDSLRPAN